MAAVLTSVVIEEAIMVLIMAGSITNPAHITTEAAIMAMEDIPAPGSVTSTEVMQVTAITGMVALTGMVATIAEPAIAVNRAFRALFGCFTLMVSDAME